MKSDEEYLDEQFPKGDKRRGEAMVLMALARIQGAKIQIESIQEFIKENEI